MSWGSPECRPSFCQLLRHSAFLPVRRGGARRGSESGIAAPGQPRRKLHCGILLTPDASDYQYRNIYVDESLKFDPRVGGTGVSECTKGIGLASACAHCTRVRLRTDPTLVILISASEGVPRESNVWKFLFLGSSSSITCFSWMSRVALRGGGDVEGIGV
jgi:hypothetical protein